MKQCVDPKLNNEYPPKAIAKVIIYFPSVRWIHRNFIFMYILISMFSTCVFWKCFCFLQLAAVAALCVQYEADFRPNMTIVVKALQPLLNSKPAGPEAPA